MQAPFRRPKTPHLRDPLTYTVVGALITVVSLIATIVPAQRATRVDPPIALRAE